MVPCAAAFRYEFPLEKTSLIILCKGDVDHDGMRISDVGSKAGWLNFMSIEPGTDFV